MPPCPADPVFRSRLLVIRNPVARRRHGRRFDDTIAALAARGCALTIVETTGPGAARTIAGDAREEDFDGVAVAGGDGTVNEVINGLGRKALPVGLIPLGTANVLARELELPFDPPGVAETIARGPSVPIHLGDVNGRRFVLMAGVGFDAFVVSRVPARLKRVAGKAAYVAETLRSAVAYRFPPFRLTLDGNLAHAASAVIANGRLYGGPFTCTPDARLGDPLLHVCLFERGGRLNAARYAVGLVTGRLDRLADVRVVAAREVVVEGPVGDPVQGDGDIVGLLPARITVAPEVIHVIRRPAAPATAVQAVSAERAPTNSASPV